MLDKEIDKGLANFVSGHFFGHLRSTPGDEVLELYIEANDWRIRDFIQTKSPEPSRDSGLAIQDSVSGHSRLMEDARSGSGGLSYI